MHKIMTIAAVAGLALATTVAPQPAQARDGVNAAIAGGVVGGLALGAIAGSQRGYYGGGPGYYDNGYAYAPVYGACHTERQQFEDGYGRIRVRRVRVCD